jgi:hypothetical protein
MWTDDVVKAAHAARDRRQRGEPMERAVDQMSGLQVMAEACSYRGHAPPETIRSALYALTHGRGGDGLIPEELAAAYNAASQAVMKRAIARFISETNAERDGGGTTPR